MGLAADAQNMTGTASDSGTLEMLTENAAFFDQAGIISDAFRTMLWTIIKVLRSALNSFDGMLEKTNDGLPGLALENDTAVIAENGRLRVMIAREGAHAYFFRRVNGAWLRTALRDGEELPL